MSGKNISLVSVIIPVFNDQAGLLKCIEAMSSQSYPPQSLEIIVVDNGSTPSIKVENSLGLNIKVIRCEKPGSYAARNAGSEVASGDLFAFTDADCWPAKDWLKSGVATLESHGGRAFVGGEVEIVEPPSPSVVALYQRATSFGQESNIKEKKFTGTLNLFCTKELFRSVGGFEDRLLSGGDREWSWRALKRGFSLVYEPTAVIYTEPRTTLRGAILQARRITAGRRMLREFGLAHVGSQNIAKKRSVWQSAVWLLCRKELSTVERVQILSIAVVIRFAESVEGLRLALGARAERR
ncbi:glycosyltransferase [Marinobacter sp. M3C]|jgi:glycosyltransferase involved in cell wall biosynthesis|uniref:glycosyltransferase n=1 Tax=Marinobacter sp. M3C TaxID=2917715 RepID=UPI00200DA970|nr:glycosyltransferase [Marinobacter sp. M3C]MCL1477301.1 glycosyltransferase [Marinobacter sp.]UQG61799.1 glycosyltransferase [Marinobacter sp. M3C]